MSDTQTYPYFAPAGFFQRWQLHEGAQACRRLDHNQVDGACLSLSRTAPGIVPTGVQKAAEAQRQQERAAKGYGFFKGALREALDEHKVKAEASAAAKQAQAAAPKVPEVKPKPHKVEPLDLQDIPPVMDRLKWEHSAALMRQFFAGELNYSKTTDDESKGINQNGEQYASQFVETKRFTWKWLLEYAAVDRAYQHLISLQAKDTPNNIYNKSSKGAIPKTIVDSANAKLRGQIDALAECGGDIFALHRKFQFQYSEIKMFSSPRAMYPNTDLGGALGNFGIYAAVAYATVERPDFKPHTVTVTHVYIYAKDNYSFNDKPGDPSQYLGHWNKTGVIFVPTPELVSAALGLFGYSVEINVPVLRADPSIPWVDGADFTVILGEQYKVENIFYPVRNRDFWNWQMQHQRGGNVLSFSELELIRLEQPMTFVINPRERHAAI